MSSADVLPVIAPAIEAMNLPADISKQILTRLQDSNLEILSIDGLVYGIKTKKVNGVFVKEKAIEERDDKGNLVRIVFFRFPPNDEEYDSEIKRAQNHGKQVEVNYHTDPNGANIIDSVNVH